MGCSLGIEFLLSHDLIQGERSLGWGCLCLLLFSWFLNLSCILVLRFFNDNRCCFYFLLGVFLREFKNEIISGFLLSLRLCGFFRSLFRIWSSLDRDRGFLDSFLFGNFLFLWNALSLNFSFRNNLRFLFLGYLLFKRFWFLDLFLRNILFFCLFFLIILLVLLLFSLCDFYFFWYLRYLFFYFNHFLWFLNFYLFDLLLFWLWLLNLRLNLFHLWLFSGFLSKKLSFEI